jgi:hypothetical protein
VLCSGVTAEWSGMPGTARVFGTGCGNPALALVPVPNAAPTISTTAKVTLANIPSAVAFLALGWSRTSMGPFTLPLSLSGYGMSGCALLQSAETAGAPVSFTSAGNATYTLLLPNWTALIGVRSYLQAWALAPGVNAGNAIVSNGVEWTVGF